MFCSKCGKSIAQKAQQCPSCGNPLGENRMDGFTSVQKIYAPGETAPEKSKYTPYTRLSYSTSDEAEQEDVYSRTTYRPILMEQEQPEPEQAESEDDEATPTVPAETEDAEPAPFAEEATEDEEPLEPIELPELKKAVKKGISPELEEAMRQMLDGAKPSRESRSLRDLFGRKADDTEEDEEDEEEDEEEDDSETVNDAEQPASESETPEDEAEAEPKKPVRRSERKKMKTGKTVKKSKKKKGVPAKWIKIGLCALVVLALVAGGVLLVDTIVNSSQIRGVTKDFREKGIELLESHTSDSYRKNAILLYKQDETAMLLLEQQTADQQLYRDLMPEEPLENDAAFLDALLSIQESIDNATMVDAIIQASDENATLKAQSAQSWSAIDSAIKRLKVCSDVEELPTIMADAVAAVSTPVPLITPEPEAIYDTLSKGMKSTEVKQMQQRLFELGFFNGKRDGAFGDVTKRAVKQFQEAAGLTANGIADSPTLELLYSEDAPMTGVKADTASPAEGGTEAEPAA